MIWIFLKKFVEDLVCLCLLGQKPFPDVRNLVPETSTEGRLKIRTSNLKNVPLIEGHSRGFSCVSNGSSSFINTI
jgi:hypothetical protein